MELHCQSCSDFDSGRAEKSFAKGCWAATSWRSVTSGSAASFTLEPFLEDRLWTLIYFTSNVYRVNQCYHNVWGWLVYQNQFSYSRNSSGLCSLFIYFAFQPYITKNMGLCVASDHTQALNLSELWDKWTRTKICLFFQLFPLSASQIPAVTHVWCLFMCALCEVSEEGQIVHFIQFSVRSGCAESLLCGRVTTTDLPSDPHLPSPSSGDELMHDGSSRANSGGLNTVVDRGLDSSLNCTFCSLVSPPSILDLSQERIGSWCSHLGVQKIDVLKAHKFPHAHKPLGFSYSLWGSLWFFFYLGHCKNISGIQFWTEIENNIF